MKAIIAALLFVLFYTPSSCVARLGIPPAFTEDERQLFLVDPSELNGTAVSDAYEDLGYDSEHALTCSYYIYGTLENAAAGERDLRAIASYFMREFNRISKTDPNTPMLMIHAEVTSQKVGRVVESRRLAEDGRRLLMVPYAFGYLISKFVCRGCSLDNGDGRRIMQENISGESFADNVMNDLLRKNTTDFIKSALESTNCLRIQCDGGDFLETEACTDFPVD